MSHTTKSTVQCHLDSKKHQVAVETMQKREKARVERRLEAEADALPHKAAMRQPSLQSVVASCNDKNKAADDTVFAFAGAGIPLDKLDHPLVRAWLQKYGVWGGGSIGALLLLAEGVTPLLLNHSRRVRLPYHALHVEPGP